MMAKRKVKEVYRKFPKTPHGIERIAVYPQNETDEVILVGLDREKGRVYFFTWDKVAEVWITMTVLPHLEEYL